MVKRRVLLKGVGVRVERSLGSLYLPGFQNRILQLYSPSDNRPLPMIGADCRVFVDKKDIKQGWFRPAFFVPGEKLAAR